MAARITVWIHDDNNVSYDKRVEMIIPTRMHRILTTYDMDEYDDQWDALCDMIENDNPDLPRSWYIDKIAW